MDSQLSLLPTRLSRDEHVSRGKLIFSTSLSSINASDGVLTARRFFPTLY